MREKVGAVIVAAGESRRMKGVDKLFAEMDGQPLLARVLGTFQDCDIIDEIVVVTSQGNLRRMQILRDEYGWSKVSGVCLGGARRQDSVREGLTRLTDCRWAVIHDGARPLVSADLIERGLAEARHSGAAIAAVPAKDTIKIASNDGFVKETPNRDTLWLVQTPQVFRLDLIKQAHAQVNEDASDDAALVEMLGHRVRLYMGSYENIKVTTPEDIAVARTILGNRQEGDHKESPLRN